MLASQACRKLLETIEGFKEAVNDDSDVEEAEPEVFTMADEETIMTHMMDCVAFLAAIQQQQRQQQDIPVHAADVQASRNRAFVAALSIVGESLLNCASEKKQPKPTNAAIGQLLKAFSVPGTTYPIEIGRKGWFPLHWAVALVSSEQHDVTEADVKALYALDPMAMQTMHVDTVEDDYEDEDVIGFNPAHLLCMSPVTPCTMQLIRSFAVCNPPAFGSTTTVSALHVACRYGTPTVELLQHLLQLDSSQVMTKVSFNGMTHCPLGHLCFNLVNRDEELPHAEELVNSLLVLDKSDEIVGDALFGCIAGISTVKIGDKALADKWGDRVSGMVERLLMLNPEAAKYRGSTGDSMLHEACSTAMPSKLCIDIIKLVLTVHKNAVREPSLDGWLPIYYAAKFANVEVVEFLLGVYPEAASLMTSDGRSLFYLAFGDNDSSGAVSKIRYLASRYPALVQQRDDDGELPVHRATMSHRYGAMLALYDAGGVEQFTTPIAHPTDAMHYENGYLPLHLFISPRPLSAPLRCNPVSELADVFRLLLRLYPEAAGIEGGVGAAFKKTPYQMAVDYKLSDYFLRLMLRAAPTLNPPELHRLNYEERRMAMFLAFKAIAATTDAPLVARLRGENKDLVQRVVSFL